MKNSSDAVNSQILALNAKNQNETWKLADKKLSPSEYGGMRGFRNKLVENFGVGRDFDRENLLSGIALKSPKLIGMSERRSSALQNVYNKKEEETYNNLTQAGEDPAVAAAKAKLEAEQAVVDLMTEEEKLAASTADYHQQSSESLRTMGDSIGSALMDAGKDAFIAPFESLGESLVTGEDAADALAANMKNIAGSLLKNVGTAMATAGFQIAGAAALSQNWAGVAGGLALAAAGGFASGLGGALTASDSDSDDTEDKTKKLESLRDSIVDLLAQAREDALYYENTLRHKKALSTNSSLNDVVSVNDAVITPQGKIVSTAPDDYLIATKTPHSLVNSGGSPNINFNLVDKSTGVKVTTQKATYNEKTNTVDFEAIIESKVTEIIASSKGDDAFNAREARLRGRHVIA
jgi:hypothetical protein